MLFCAACAVKNCASRLGEEKEYPSLCPTFSTITEEAGKKYLEDETDRLLAVNSAVCSPDHSEGRIMKTLRFAKMCGYKKLGLAFCSTLRDQALAIYKLMLSEGFEVESVICKVGHKDRSMLGVPPSCNAMCNPIAQAELLNEAKTELNLILGLCVGHDSLFIRHSQAPVTVIAVKDHVYDHAPLEYLK